jgi:hypothetical protein
MSISGTSDQALRDWTDERMSHRNVELLSLYNSYCNFGMGKNGSTEGLDGRPQMDNARFAKFCRELILDKLVTSTDADIIFNKVKKTARKLEFAQFQEALKLLAEKKYPKNPVCYSLLIDAILQKGSGPTVNATVYYFS